MDLEIKATYDEAMAELENEPEQVRSAILMAMAHYRRHVNTGDDAMVAAKKGAFLLVSMEITMEDDDDQAQTTLSS